MKIQTLFLLILLILPTVNASEKYSFEKAEELKPLIEWREFNPDSIKEAQDENKPIFFLLTAPSWCYWCQVYESEDYLFHPRMVEYINSNLIPIYVDADQRQDLTRQYLEGGWPSTTVFTPAMERLYGYSGPRPVENMLTNLQNAVNHVKTNPSTYKIEYNYEKVPVVIPDEIRLRAITNNYGNHNLNSVDKVNGGFGQGQKFPQGRTLDYFLDLYEKSGDKKWLDPVILTLENSYTESDKLKTDYNLFDPIDGGFHRYGTTKEWTPPHYEKMLYDNARLLKTYFHLLQLDPENELASEVVSKTHKFMIDNWYDSEEGGFYGNSDVHGEDAYYGENPRPTPMPRVEKTKYSNWNAETIMTYLYLYSETREEEYKEISVKSLDFFRKEMVTKEGVLHYYKTYDDTKGVRGTLLDNSYMLLSFVEGYIVLEDEKYLKTAEKIADYILEKLYDVHSGGFFDRNSPDEELYAPGENIRLSKPVEENSITIYALLKLYDQTKEVKYLNAGMKSLGNQIERISALDRGYYFVKIAEFVLDKNLIKEYESYSEEIAKIDEKNSRNFWVDELVSKKQNEFVFSNEGVETLNAPLIFLVVIALLSGLISFISPCTLPIIPAYVAYSLKSDEKKIEGMTIAFHAGLITIFTILGMSATLIGEFLRDNLTIFSQVAGGIIFLMGVMIIFGKGFSGPNVKISKPTSYFGSFIFGMSFGISWTPCIGPILVAILILASTTADVIMGGLLLVFYGAGLSIPLLLISYFISKIDKKGKFWKFIKGKNVKVMGKKFHSTSLISGVIFIVLGVLVFSGILYTFNQYVATSAFQELIFGFEEFFLEIVK